MRHSGPTVVEAYGLLGCWDKRTLASAMCMHVRPDNALGGGPASQHLQGHT